LRKPLVNNQIRAREVRVIDETGKNLGIFLLEKAIDLAREKGLDLVQLTDKATPPVCKITDYGKYLYQQQKKERSTAKHHKGGELKGIRLTFGMSDHDLETRVNAAKKFLEKKDKIRIEMRLRGREKAHQDFAKEKILRFVELLKESIPIKIEKELKKEPRGLTMIISKDESTKKNQEPKTDNPNK